MDRVSFGKRAMVYSGTANLQMILREERAGKYIKKVQEEAEDQGEMLVMGKTCSRFIVSNLLTFYSVRGSWASGRPTQTRSRLSE